MTATLVVATVQGKACSRKWFNSWTWKPALRAPAIPDTRENGRQVLRHTFASHFAAGVNIRPVAACLGHEDPSFALRV